MSLSEILEEKQFIIIDDDETTLFYTNAVIKKFFYYKDVISFKNPGKAIEFFETTFSRNPSPMVVLLDINMPEFSGWDVLDRLQVLPIDIKEKLSVIMVSSSIDTRDKIKATEYALVIGYIEKPLSIKKLKDLIELGQSTTSRSNG